MRMATHRFRSVLTAFLSSGDRASDQALLEIQKSAEFWELGCGFISEGGHAPEAEFFVLNMLYRKVHGPASPDHISRRVEMPGPCLLEFCATGQVRVGPC